MKILSLKLPESLDEALEAAAARQGTTKSALLREALASYLEHTGQVSEPAAPYGEEKPPRASFLALAGDLAGCVEGPPDLSTNPEHLRGFGQ